MQKIRGTFSAENKLKVKIDNLQFNIVFIEEHLLAKNSSLKNLLRNKILEEELDLKKANVSTLKKEQMLAICFLYRVVSCQSLQFKTNKRFASFTNKIAEQSLIIKGF